MQTVYGMLQHLKMCSSNKVVAYRTTYISYKGKHILRDCDCST